MNISNRGTSVKRRYDSPRRRAAAKRTREGILRSAKAEFEAQGWSGTTIAAIAEEAGVSRKTVELLFGTKAALLGAVLDFAIRGDDDPTLVIERPTSVAIEEAPDAEAMLELHAQHVVAIGSRSARIAAVIESAAPSSGPLAELWDRMNANRRFGARWAAENLVAKPGVRPDLGQSEAEQTFLVAIDWGTYRLLTRELGLDAAGVREWLLGFYRRCFLPEARDATPSGP